MEERPEYRVARIDGDFLVPGKPSFWNALPVTTIDHYLWLDNGYRPRVEIRACYSRRYLYLFFKVFESKIRARFTGFQNPVYKDSCVELFIDPFPEKTIGYINLETNALGAALIAIGPDRARRKAIAREDIKDFQIAPSVSQPVEGVHGAEFWALAYRLPLSVFEKHYGERIAPGHIARANFYKCGDETEIPHYGAWSPVASDRPDFHRPDSFGRLLFL
ncbi:MAG TPA: carbohydrate-binding family 9-like protein [Candidatus Desulfaltia sp.]|nr:carbohydrate-binding family 9-like protein [Candidatus Desulfaltia sp.]